MRYLRRIDGVADYVVFGTDRLMVVGGTGIEPVTPAV
jgi:hypothetical protein